MNRHEFKKMRLKLNISQTVLASVIGKHSMTISKIERGVLKPFDLRRVLEKLVWNGNMATDWLRRLNNPPPTGEKE